MYEKAKDILKDINVLIVEDEHELLDIMVESIEDYVNKV